MLISDSQHVMPPEWKYVPLKKTNIHPIRWSEFLYEMIKNFKDSTPENNALIVTHGGMIRVITKHLLQFSSRPLGLNLAHCGIGNNSISVFELEVSDAEIVNCDVVKVFDCKHLQRSC